MNFSEAIAQLGFSDDLYNKYKVDISARTSHTSSHSKVEYNKVCEVPVPSVGLALALFIPLLLRKTK